ncbi:MAG: hypothetical protein LBJ67_01260 [Planctomycetaceae bacterium]|jgi:hypothetical protein|nr:hypothetical protein [Planctomycetaceae bacterium]
MKTLFWIFCAGVSFTLISICGCGQSPGLPGDFPKIYPCEISVIQEGKPLEDAMVSLNPIGNTDKYAGGCSATTDAHGKAFLMTYGQNGIPAGKYKILISKLKDEGGKEVEDPFGIKSIQGGKVYSYIEAKYSDKNLTPYEIEIKDKKEVQTLQCDVGAAIHKYLRDVN